ncbi:MAG: peptidoglycan-binding protein [Candidatus Omnitrophota bacterium]
MSFKKAACITIILSAVMILSSGCAKKQPASLPEDTLPPIELIQPSQMAQPQQVPTPTPQMPQSTITITPAQTLQEPSVESTVKMSREKEIQMALKNAGFYTGEIDGVVGSKTKKAIKDFQASKGLTVDGKVGPKTWAELERFLVAPQESTN